MPLLASPQGGVAERSRNDREASADREDGVVFRSRLKGKPPRLRPFRWLRDIFLMTQPPLLAVMQGGAFALFRIYSHLDRSRLQSNPSSVPARIPQNTFATGIDRTDRTSKECGEYRRWFCVAPSSAACMRDTLRARWVRPRVSLSGPVPPCSGVPGSSGTTTASHGGVRRKYRA